MNVNSLKGVTNISVAATFLLIAFSTSQSLAEGSIYQDDVLSAVMQLYNESENEAVDRLAKEEIAATAYHHIRNSNLKSYAGAWIDKNSLRLIVALSNPDEVKVASQFGVDPVVVTHSLRDLIWVQNEFTSELRSVRSGANANIVTWIDYERNEVAFELEAALFEDIEHHRDALFYDTLPIRVSEADNFPVPSTGGFRGADGIWNQRTQLPCSVGASVVGGYVTAGHCGAIGDDMQTPSQQAFSEIDDSTFTLDPDPQVYIDYEDGAFAIPNTGWTPLPQVNGYSVANLHVSAEWSGVLEAPVNATVCRYGQTSGGPNCGTIEAKNVNAGEGVTWLAGLVRASGDICTEPGDSGGPYLTPSDQMQGTNHGGAGAEHCGSTPQVDANYVVYQPIRTTLDRFDKTMLTSHGSNAPDIVDLSCSPQGGSMIFCSTGYESQGTTTVQWKLNGVVQGSGTARAISCTASQNETVQASATNPYGTGSDSINVYCHGGPPW